MHAQQAHEMYEINEENDGDTRKSARTRPRTTACPPTTATTTTTIVKFERIKGYKCVLKLCKQAVDWSTTSQT